MENGSLTKSVLVSATWQFGAKVLMALTRVISFIVLSRLLLPDDFAVSQVVMVVVNFSNNFGVLGLGVALIQKEKIDNRHILTTFWSYIFLGTFSAFLIYASSGLISSFMKMPSVKEPLELICILPLILALTSVSNHILAKELKFRVLAISEVISYLFGYLLFAVILALNGWGYWSLVIASIIQSAISGIIVSFYAPVKPKWLFNWEIFREFFNFGFFNTLGRFFGGVGNQADTIIIGRLLGNHALGLYNRAFSLVVSNINLFSTVLDKIFFSAFSKRQNQPDIIAKAYLQADYVVNLLSFPLAAYCFVNAETLISLLIGERWLDASDPFKILCLTIPLRLNNKIGVQTLRAVGNIRQVTENHFWFMIIIIVLLIALSPLGLAGISAGVVLAMMFQNFQVTNRTIKAVPLLSWKKMVLSSKYIFALTAGYVILGSFLNQLFLSKYPYWAQILIQGVMLLLVYVPLAGDSKFKSTINIFTASIFKKKQVNEATSGS